jgi:protoporphyrinogen oxidase
MRFTGFEGEANRICHSVRDGKKFKRKATSDVLDVIVIGAGVSGLTAAYKLRDKLRVRVIEKEDSIGGASRRGNWRGIYYSYGAADTGPTYEIEYEGKRINYLEPLFKELGIPWKRVADPSDAFLFKNRLVIDPFSRPGLDLPTSSEERKGFEDAIAYIEKVKEKFGELVIPPEANSKEVLQLDKRNLREIFSGFGDYFLLFLDRYSESTFGAPATEISAFAGLYYLSRELQERFACPGGNACVSENLASHLEGNVEINSTVVSIEQERDVCYVTSVDEQGAQVTLQSKAVIMACPKHYAPYIIKDLPEDQKRAFGKVRYDSYIVANVLTSDAIYDGAFATYFDDTLFTDIVVADWVATDGAKKAHSGEPEVYTLYCPVGERKRYKVLNEPAETWIRQILDGLNKHFPDAEKKIVDIRLRKYGHHYVLAYPGFITGPRSIAKKPFGNVFFAKDDMQGVPCLESAVWSGLDAANRVLERIA